MHESADQFSITTEDTTPTTSTASTVIVSSARAALEQTLAAQTEALMDTLAAIEDGSIYNEMIARFLTPSLTDQILGVLSDPGDVAGENSPADDQNITAELAAINSQEEPEISDPRTVAWHQNTESESFYEQEYSPEHYDANAADDAQNEYMGGEKWLRDAEASAPEPPVYTTPARKLEIKDILKDAMKTEMGRGRHAIRSNILSQYLHETKSGGSRSATKSEINLMAARKDARAKQKEHLSDGMSPHKLNIKPLGKTPSHFTESYHDSHNKFTESVLEDFYNEHLEEPNATNADKITASISAHKNRESSFSIDSDEIMTWKFNDSALNTEDITDDVKSHSIASENFEMPNSRTKNTAVDAEGTTEEDAVLGDNPEWKHDFVRKYELENTPKGIPFKEATNVSGFGMNREFDCERHDTETVSASSSDDVREILSAGIRKAIAEELQVSHYKNDANPVSFVDVSFVSPVLITEAKWLWWMSNRALGSGFEVGEVFWSKSHEACGSSRNVKARFRAGGYVARHRGGWGCDEITPATIPFKKSEKYTYDGEIDYGQTQNNGPNNIYISAAKVESYSTNVRTKHNTLLNQNPNSILSRIKGLKFLKGLFWWLDEARIERELVREKQKLHKLGNSNVRGVG